MSREVVVVVHREWLLYFNIKRDLKARYLCLDDEQLFFLTMSNFRTGVKVEKERAAFVSCFKTKWTAICSSAAWPNKFGVLCVLRLPGL